MLPNDQIVIGWPTGREPTQQQARDVRERFNAFMAGQSITLVLPFPVDVRDLRTKA